MTSALFVAVVLIATVAFRAGPATAGTLAQSTWTASNTALGATSVSYTWSFVSVTTSPLTAITLGVPAGTTNLAPSVDTMFGLAGDSSGPPVMLDDSVHLVLSGGAVIRAGTLVTLVINGFTNPSSSSFAASTITTANGSVVDQGTTNALAFVPNTSPVTVVVPVSATVATVPSAPLGITAVVPTAPVLANGAVVTWSAPLSDGGAAINAYRVVPLDVSTGVAGTTVSFSAAATSATLAGLVAGDAYDFTVLATNSVGDSNASNASNIVVPTTSPSLGTTSDTGSSSSSTGVVQLSVRSSGTSANKGGSTAGSSGSNTNTPLVASASIGAASVAAIPTSAPIAPLVVAATAVGSGSLTLAFFGTNPMPALVAAPTTGATPSYIDVQASGSNHFSAVGFTACGISPGSAVQWWNPISLTLEPVSSVAADPNDPTCLDVNITANSSPSISQLYGTLFVVHRPGSGDGLLVTNTHGRVFASGATPLARDVHADQRSTTAYAAVLSTPDGKGYLLVSAHGGVNAYGDASFHGSLPTHGIVSTSPIVAGAVTPDAKGYWLVNAAGAVYRFGDARFYGSIRSMDRALHVRVVGFAALPDGKGYWLATEGGSVYQFGEAPFLGSLRTLHANPGAGIVGLAGAPDGKGYWLATANGAVYAFGSAASNAVASHSPRLKFASITGLAVTPDGLGYWLVGRHGVLHAFGDAQPFASVPKRSVTPNALIAGIATVP